MSFAKLFLLSIYYGGSYPHRAWRNAQWRRQGRSPVMVLFYHRIADDRANRWTASNAVFERQVRWLQRHFDLVSLAEAQRRVRSAHNHRPSVTITFDDGYADNCTRALPLLIREQIPCTYFVATRHILEGLPFRHDSALGRPLAPNTPQQIRELARSGIELGVHTRTHADLGRSFDADRLYDEIVVARGELQELTGTTPRYFAFPFGQHANLNPEAFRLARETGYDGVCSAYGGFNFPGDDAFHLQRIHVDDDMIRLKNWVTVDPRKLRSIRRYLYETKKIHVPVGPAGVCA
jgi:peptidoglycan/xylan/chitin deacetylase (PgdA/CDA1 family)